MSPYRLEEGSKARLFLLVDLQEKNSDLGLG